MQLTPEQQEQIRTARAAEERRATLRFTTAQRDEWKRAVEEELAGKEANLAHLRKVQAACEQPGFFGDVRRAIVLRRRPIDELASEIGVAPSLLSDFCAGETQLPPVALERLIETLGLRLMQEIPR